MDTHPTETGSVIADTNTTPSMLDQIIQTAHDSSAIWDWSHTASPIDMTAIPGVLPPVKKPRDPMTTSTVFKLIGSLLLVAVIFFGSFLAYVVFNPDQAAFFVNIFGINPNDIQRLLKNLINGSFGIVVLIFSIIWIMSLFRAIWTPRDQKRRRLTSWLTAGVIGIFLFGILAFWAYLFGIINATNYTNLGGDVMIYDNDLYTNPVWREYAQLSTTKNLIGPITLKYDLSTNAATVAKKDLLTIESYEINFDGAKCTNDKSIITGSDPVSEQWLICTFDQVRTYNIRGTYSGHDRLGAPQSVNIPISTVEIKGLVEITSNTNKDGKKIITINAAKAKNLGNPRWQYSTLGSREESKSSITELISSTPLMVCLRVIDTACDRYFIIVDSDSSTIVWSIVFDTDSANHLTTMMSLTGINISSNEIIDIDWISSDGTRLCQGTDIQCHGVFTSYGTRTITATIRLANGQSYPIEGTVILNEPLIVARHTQLRDQDSKILNTIDTYDPTIGAYIIKNITLPQSITLDARDVVTENLGYNLREVIWKISDGKKIIEKVWSIVTFEIPQTQRYTIEAQYIFDKNIVQTTADTRTARDLIILDLAHQSLEPVLNIQQSSDYTPAKVTVDASSSLSKNGTIQKFIFDFGEGKSQTEWDAIQTYEYRTPGEKKIILTIIDNNNEQVSISKYIILKDTPKNIAFTTSMSPAIIATPITFTADGATGQIEEYIWNYGDNTPVSKWYEVDHAFARIGKYTITLTVRYTDGTERTTTQSLQVDAALE
jgi:PKD domain